MIAGLGGNLYNRGCADRGAKLLADYSLAAISEVEADLHASAEQMSLTVALFILIQGGFPVFWSAISEIQGRKVGTRSNVLSPPISTHV